MSTPNKYQTNNNSELIEGSPALAELKRAGTISRAVIRVALWQKAKRDITVRYGGIGLKSGLFCGFDQSFPRRIRRRVARAMVKRWYWQIKKNCEASGIAGFTQADLRKLPSMGAQA